MRTATILFVLASGAAGVLGATACDRASSATESRGAAAAASGALAPSSTALPLRGLPGVVPLRGLPGVVGKAAPDFELRDLEGHAVRLSSLRGKIVVLEWFNPECPFVRASHTKGSLKGFAATQTQKGIIWLAINSAAQGKQGYGVEANVAGKRRYALEHPVLLDETGDVGRAYDARHTPHMFVVDAQGVLVYRGAIDNSPDGEGESPKGGTLVNFVESALADLAASRPVKTPETEAYGCSVKYASK